MGVPSALPYGVFGEIRVLYFYPVPVFSTVLVLSIGSRPLAPIRDPIKQDLRF